MHDVYLLKRVTRKECIWQANANEVQNVCSAGQNESSAFITDSGAT